MTLAFPSCDGDYQLEVPTSGGSGIGRSRVSEATPRPPNPRGELDEPRGDTFSHHRPQEVLNFYGRTVLDAVRPSAGAGDPFVTIA